MFMASGDDSACKSWPINAAHKTGQGVAENIRCLSTNINTCNRTILVGYPAYGGLVK